MKYNLLSAEPTSKDEFPSLAHTNFAKKISLILKNADSNHPKLFALDGEWGCGKSSAVKIIKEEIEFDDYGCRLFHTFTYDAWGNQTAFTRRAILEALLRFLTEQGSCRLKCNDRPSTKKKWTDELDTLVAKTERNITTNVPHVSLAFVVFVLLIVLHPVFQTIATQYFGFGNPNVQWWQFLGAWVCYLAAPLLGAASTFIYLLIQCCNRKRGSEKEHVTNCIKRSLGRLFYLYDGREIKTETKRVLSESEPSIHDFKEYLEDISSCLQSNLLIVIDNIDRLPPSKVHELFSAIHILFLENEYPNIYVIIPITKSKLLSDKTNGAFSKTFPIVYRMPNPIYSDWKGFLKSKSREAIPTILDEEIAIITNLYSFSHWEQTPRKIKAYVNGIITILIQHEDVSVSSAAAYLILTHKESNAKSGLDLKLLDGDGINSDLNGLIKPIDNLQRELASIHYGIAKDEAIEVIISSRLKGMLEAFSENDKLLIENSKFFDLLSNYLQAGDYKNEFVTIELVAKSVSSLNSICTLLKSYQPVAVLWDYVVEHADSISSSIVELGKPKIEILMNQVSREKLQFICNSLLESHVKGDQSFIAKIDFLKKCLVARNETLETLSINFSRRFEADDFLILLDEKEGDWLQYLPIIDQTALLQDVLEKLRVGSDSAVISRLYALQYVLHRKYSKQELSEFSRELEKRMSGLTNLDYEHPIRSELLFFLWRIINPSQQLSTYPQDNVFFVESLAKGLRDPFFTYEELTVAYLGYPYFQESYQQNSDVSSLYSGGKDQVNKDCIVSLYTHYVSFDKLLQLSVDCSLILLRDSVSLILAKDILPIGIDLNWCMTNYKKINQFYSMDKKFKENFHNYLACRINPGTLSQLLESSPNSLDLYLEAELADNKELWDKCESALRQYVEKKDPEDLSQLFCNQQVVFNLLVTFARNRKKGKLGARYSKMLRDVCGKILKGEASFSLSVSDWEKITDAANVNSLRSAMSEALDIYLVQYFQFPSHTLPSAFPLLITSRKLRERNDDVARVVWEKLCGDPANVVSCILPHKDKFASCCKNTEAATNIVDLLKGQLANKQYQEKYEKEVDLLLESINEDRSEISDVAS